MGGGNIGLKPGVGIVPQRYPRRRQTPSFSHLEEKERSQSDRSGITSFPIVILKKALKPSFKKKTLKQNVCMTCMRIVKFILLNLFMK